MDLDEFSEFGNKILNFLPVFRGDLQGFQYGACSSTGRLTCGNPWEKAAWLENVWISTVFLPNKTSIYGKNTNCHSLKPFPKVIWRLYERFRCGIKLKILWKTVTFWWVLRLPVSSLCDATVVPARQIFKWAREEFSHTLTGKSMINGGYLFFNNISYWKNTFTLCAEVLWVKNKF